MIILVQGMYSKAELNSDSNYVHCAGLMRGMAKVRPDWHFLYIWPDDKSGYKYDNDGFFSLPNVTRIPQRISTRKMANAVSFDAGWYDTLWRSVAIDLVWCQLVEIAPNLRHAGDNPYSKDGKAIVVAEHNYVVHESLPYPFESQDHVAWAQIGGGVLSDWNIFHTAHCRAMWAETAAKWLTPQTIEQVLARSSHIPIGVLEPTLAPRPRMNDVPIIIYNHRLQHYKNYRDTFELLDELHREGVPFKVWFTNSTPDKIGVITGYPFVEIKLCATRDVYLKTIAQGDLNVTNSSHETFCIAAAESMALGQPIVAPAGVTFPEITGQAENGYPYLFRSRDEQKAMLRKLLAEPAERLRWGATLSAYVKKEYNAQLWAERHAALWEKLQPQAGTIRDPRSEQMIAEQLRIYSGSTLRELYTAVTSQKIDGHKPFGSNSLPLVKLARIVRTLGGRVKMENGAQRVYTR